MDAVVKPHAYAVWDNETAQWWDLRSFRSKSAAANSWNAAQRYERPRGPRYSEQGRYETKGVRFVVVE